MPVSPLAADHTAMAHAALDRQLEILNAPAHGPRPAREVLRTRLLRPRLELIAPLIGLGASAPAC